MNVLFVYSSRFGYTLKISQFMANILENNKINYEIKNIVDILNMEAIEEYLELYDGIIVAASIRYGHYARDIINFINRYNLILNKKISAFVSVSILATKENRNTPQTHTYTRKLFQKVEWKPRLIAIFPGELDYQKYSFIDKYMMKLVMTINKAENNFSAKIEYTNWQKVEEFTMQFTEELMSKT